MQSLACSSKISLTLTATRYKSDHKKMGKAVDNEMKGNVRRNPMSENVSCDPEEDDTDASINGWSRI